MADDIVSIQKKLEKFKNLSQPINDVINSKEYLGLSAEKKIRKYLAEENRSEPFSYIVTLRTQVYTEFGHWPAGTIYLVQPHNHKNKNFILKIDEPAWTLLVEHNQITTDLLKKITLFLEH